MLQLNVKYESVHYVLFHLWREHTCLFLERTKKSWWILKGFRVRLWALLRLRGLGSVNFPGFGVLVGIAARQPLYCPVACAPQCSLAEVFLPWSVLSGGGAGGSGRRSAYQEVREGGSETGNLFWPLLYHPAFMGHIRKHSPGPSWDVPSSRLSLDSAGSTFPVFFWAWCYCCTAQPEVTAMAAVVPASQERRLSAST